jgi:hemerythrin-like domain-containing protein
MATPTVKLPSAVVTLQDEHRYMNLLLGTLEEQLETSDLATPEDYFLMQDIVRYLHEYPDAVHHPTEDLLFDKLVRRKPDARKDVTRLRHDHDKLRVNTAELLQSLENAAAKHTSESAETVGVELNEYIRRLRRHMSFEEAHLFPNAVQCLAHKDWQAIETRLSAVEDPLFGRAVASDYRPLYEYFANRASTLSRGATRIGFLQLDSMIVSADAIETGVTEYFAMLQQHAEALVQESRNTMHASFRGKGIGAALAAQVRFARFVGKTGFDIACKTAAISGRTIKNAVEPLWNSAS